MAVVVVPTLYFLLERGKENFVAGGNWLDMKRQELYASLSGEDSSASAHHQ
uniref:hypothetical protein n=1 Tax=Candidatus Electronema sp. TaxID=2698783 RepID=UPI004056EEC6